MGGLLVKFYAREVARAEVASAPRSSLRELMPSFVRENRSVVNKLRPQCVVL
jgi:hypothetical protein